MRGDSNAREVAALVDCQRVRLPQSKTHQFARTDETCCAVSAPGQSPGPCQSALLQTSQEKRASSCPHQQRHIPNGKRDSLRIRRGITVIASPAAPKDSRVRNRLP